MPKLIDITNQRFGRLLVVSACKKRTASGSVRWKCICNCGTIIQAQGNNLSSGNTTSCGCARDGNPTHGLHNSPEYRAWCHMKGRCLTATDTSYHNYGGRGISVCDRWMKFENFHADMGDKPTDKHQIDRINNNGNYEPSNCRWVLQKENARNTRVAKNWIVDGVAYESLNDAAEAFSVTRATIIHWCHGWVNGKYKYDSKPGCYSELKYADN